MASFYHHARNAFIILPEVEIYTEPSLYFRGSAEPNRLRRMEPDLAIVRRSESHATVLSVVELKFSPFWRPGFEEDLSKFECLAAALEGYCHGIEVSSGKDAEIRFEISERTQFIFGVVGNLDKNAAALDRVGLKKNAEAAGLEERFSHLGISVSASGVSSFFERLALDSVS
jgi:hypothetical protein